MHRNPYQPFHWNQRSTVSDLVDQSTTLQDLGELVASIGAPPFGARYFHLFCDVLPLDGCSAFACHRELEPPRSVVLEGNCSELRERLRALATEYVAGGFVHDPNIRRGLGECVEPQLYCLRAAELSHLSYGTRFYDRVGFAHELVMLGRVDGTAYYSSFYRKQQRMEFTAAELERVGRLARIAVQALHRHCELLGGTRHTAAATAGAPQSAGETRQHTLARLRGVLLAESYGLSPREAEICASIILGYSTIAIGFNLNISANTVATHRKRAYEKLRIHSQTELFSRYLQLVQS